MDITAPFEKMGKSLNGGHFIRVPILSSSTAKNVKLHSVKSVKQSFQKKSDKIAKTKFFTSKIKTNGRRCQLDETYNQCKQRTQFQ
jgi:hypothetical protein